MRDNNRDKDNAVRKILGYDPGLLKTGLAVMEVDEKGNLVIDSLKVYQATNVKSSPFGFLAEAMGARPAVAMKGPVKTPSWLLTNTLPSDWFFWDIPTTLMVTDIKVRAKLQHLLFIQGIFKYGKDNPYYVKSSDKGYRGLRSLNADFENDWWE